MNALDIVRSRRYILVAYRPWMARPQPENVLAVIFMFTAYSPCTVKSHPASVVLAIVSAVPESVSTPYTMPFPIIVGLATGGRPDIAVIGPFIVHPSMS